MSKLPAWVTEYAQTLADAPAWLASRRQQALERFAAEGWPTTKLEDWHHTSLAFLEQAAYKRPVPSDVAAQVDAVKQNEAGHWLVFVDGRYSAPLSNVGTVPAGVTVGALAAHLNDADVEASYGQADAGTSVAALNLALAEDGAYVHVARGVVLEEPVHLLFMNTCAEGSSFPRNVIRVDAGAVATVVEYHVSANEDVASFSNVSTQVVIDADANLTHVKFQQESKQALHLADVSVTQQKSSRFESHSLSFGAKLARHNIRTQFLGERCETLFNGLYYVDGKRHVDHNTVIDHAVPNCISHEYYRGILTDMARGVFSGRIVVGKGADGTDAIQRSDSLLLSKLARSDARPELEIYADDVKCAHGATVGQLDEESLFYLRSRGLSMEEARNLLIYAFAAASLDRIRHDALRARATASISALLPGGLALAGE